MRRAGTPRSANVDMFCISPRGPNVRAAAYDLVFDTRVSYSDTSDRTREPEAGLR